MSVTSPTSVYLECLDENWRRLIASNANGCDVEVRGRTDGRCCDERGGERIRLLRDSAKIRQKVSEVGGCEWQEIIVFVGK